MARINRGIGGGGGGGGGTGGSSGGGSGGDTQDTTSEQDTVRRDYNPGATEDTISGDDNEIEDEQASTTQQTGSGPSTKKLKDIKETKQQETDPVPSDKPQIEEQADALEKSVAKQQQGLSRDDVQVVRQGDKLVAKLSESGVQSRRRQARARQQNRVEAANLQRNRFGKQISISERSAVRFNKARARSRSAPDGEQFGDIDWSFGLGGPDDEVENAIQDASRSYRQNVVKPSRSPEARENVLEDITGGLLSPELNRNAGRYQRQSKAVAAANPAAAASQALEGFETVDYLVDSFRPGQSPDTAQRRFSDTATAAESRVRAGVNRAERRPSETLVQLSAGAFVGGIAGRVVSPVLPEGTPSPTRAAGRKLQSKASKVGDIDTPSRSELADRIGEVKNKAQLELQRRRFERPPKREEPTLTQEEVEELGVIEIQDFRPETQADDSTTTDDTEGGAGTATATGDSDVSVSGGPQKLKLKTRQGTESETTTTAVQQNRVRVQAVDSLDDSPGPARLDSDAATASVASQAAEIETAVQEATKPTVAPRQEATLGADVGLDADTESVLGERTVVGPDQRTRTDTDVDTRVDEDTKTRTETDTRTRELLESDGDTDPRRRRGLDPFGGDGGPGEESVNVETRDYTFNYDVDPSVILSGKPISVDDDLEV